MKIVGLTMITNPDYRQDPWRESIAQALEIFDFVIVVCGADGDQEAVERYFDNTNKIRTVHLHWPQPEWSYEELPRHLNAGLGLARAIFSPGWIVKFDIDMAFHEKDGPEIRKALETLHAQGKKLATFEKLQFFMVDRAYEKGKIPIGIRIDSSVCYGQDETRYTDLCQPIEWDGKTRVKLNDGGIAIPKGKSVGKEMIGSTGVHVWNYDYSFKTKERAMELLYYFDRSHARWWGHSYSGRGIENVTRETAMADYLGLVSGRIQKCTKFFKPKDHPLHFVETVKNISNEQFGKDLWGIVPIPTP